MNTKPLDDDLSNLIGSSMRPLSEAAAPVLAALERAYTEPCPKCGGTGRWGFKRLQCFGCKGTGRLTFKTPADKRARARTQAAARRVERTSEAAAEAMAAFRAEHPAEAAWLAENADRQRGRAQKGERVWSLPVELADKLVRFGSLTEGQIGAIRKCMLRDQDAAPAVDASKIAAAFASARAAAEAAGEGIMDLKLRLDTFKFSPSREGNGDIWIREGDAWIAKIVAGKLSRFRICTDEQETRILAAAADPAAAARAYGQRFKSCSCCGRTLTNAQSRELGIGPICAAKWGL